MLNNTRTSIKTKLDTITDFAFVYDYHKVWAEGYPACSFEPVKIESEVHDTCNNKNIYNFDIVIQQDIWKDISRQVWLNTLIDTCEQVIHAFASDSSLSWVVDSCITWEVNFWEVIHDNWDILYCSINLSCEKLVFNL